MSVFVNVCEYDTVNISNFIVSSSRRQGEFNFSIEPDKCIVFQLHNKWEPKEPHKETGGSCVDAPQCAAIVTPSNIIDEKQLINFEVVGFLKSYHSDPFDDFSRGAPMCK